MSNLQKVAEKGNSVVLQTSGKAPEMLNFAQKCARLSQLLRESGMLGSPAPTLPTAPVKSPAEAGGATTTMDLLPNIGKSGESSKQSETVAGTASAAPSLPPRPPLPPPPPRTTTASSSNKPEDFVKQFTKTINNSYDYVPRTPAPKMAETGQMTIFYAGKVWVLDEFPEEKAREIIVLATSGSSNKKPDAQPSLSTDGKLNSGSSATPKTSTLNTFSVPKTISAQEKPPHQPQIHGCDMPIARRASLHRFLGKRKERYTAKAPCPDDDNNGNSSNNNNNLNSPREHGTGWIDLEAEPSNTDKDSEAEPSKHLDLNLDCTQ